MGARNGALVNTQADSLNTPLCYCTVVKVRVCVNKRIADTIYIRTKGARQGILTLSVATLH